MELSQNIPQRVSVAAGRPSPSGAAPNQAAEAGDGDRAHLSPSTRIYDALAGVVGNEAGRPVEKPVSEPITARDFDLFEHSQASKAMGFGEDMKIRQDGDRWILSSPGKEAVLTRENGALHVRGTVRPDPPVLPTRIHDVDAILGRGEDGHAVEYTTVRSWKDGYAKQDGEPPDRTSTISGDDAGFVRNTHFRDNVPRLAAEGRFDHQQQRQDLRDLRYDAEEVRERRNPDGSTTRTRRLFANNETVFDLTETARQTQDAAGRSVTERSGSWTSAQTHLEKRWTSTTTRHAGDPEEITSERADYADSSIFPPRRTSSERTVSLRADGARVTHEVTRDGYDDGAGNRRGERAERDEVAWPDGKRHSRGTVGTTLWSRGDNTRHLTQHFVDGRETRNEWTAEMAPEGTSKVAGTTHVPWQTPADLLAKLGDEKKIRTEHMVSGQTMRREDGGADVSVGVDVTRMVGAGGRELNAYDVNGGRVYEYKVPRVFDGERVFDSQVVFQGSSTDTITTKHDVEADGWKVEHTHAHLPEQAEGGRVPEDANSWLRIKDGAAMSDLDPLLNGNRPAGALAGARDLGAFKEFQQLAGDGKLRIVAQESDQHWRGGRVDRQARIVVETERGDRLILARDPENGSTVAHLRRAVPDGDGRLEHLSVHREGQTVDVTADERGDAVLTQRPGETVRFHVDARDGVDPALGGAGESGGVERPGWHGAYLQREQKDGVGDGVNRAGTALRTGGGVGVGAARTAAVTRSLLAGNSLRGAIAGYPQLASCQALVSGAASVTGVIAVGADIAEGRVADATRDIGATAVGVSTFSTSMGFNTAGRMFGIAGASIGIGYGLGEVLTGEYVGGGLDMAAGGGTLMGVMGAGTAFGPIGWGVALACAAGRFSWDYYKDTRVAGIAI